MRRPLSILSLTVSIAACSNGGPPAPPFLAPDAVATVTSHLMGADVAGDWRVTASYQGRSYIDDFTWPADTSPFHLTIAETRVRLEMPCQVCEAAVSFSPDVLALGTLDCVATACQADPILAQQTVAIVYNLYGSMSMHRGTVAPATPRQLSLVSSRGSIDVERRDR